MPGGGGDGDGAGARPRTQGIRGGRPRPRPRQQQTPSLPLDVVLSIAARADAATLVRCAATCAEARRRLADDPNLRAHLRLRHSDRFVLPLLRGDLVHYSRTFFDPRKSLTYLVEAAAATDGDGDGAGCRVRKVTTGGVPLASRDGLLLLHMDNNELRVCDPATGRSQAVPMPESLTDAVQFTGQYALLVGDGGDGDGDGAAGHIVGRPFQILWAYLELTPHRRYLQFRTFSSEHGAWSRGTEIRTPNLQGSELRRGLGRALVTGGAVHWLCRTDAAAYAVKLHVRAAQVTVTALPESVTHSGSGQSWWHDPNPILATSSAGGSPVVLVADGDRILAWEQSKQTAKWKPQPQVVAEAEAMLRFLDGAGEARPRLWTTTTHELRLVWFAERSGVVLVRMGDDHFFWLDLQSMAIVRWFSDRRIRISFGCHHCPYEMNLSDWTPTFGATI